MKSDTKNKQFITRASEATFSALETARNVLLTESAAIARLAKRLDENFERVLDLLAGTRGRLIVTGMGKSGLVAKKIAATFSSTGTPSFFLHPAEAIHGDLGMMVSGDTVIALSYSGETEEILRLLDRIKRLGIPLITMTGNRTSTLAQASDVILDVSIEKEACSLNLAPTASTTASLAMGDALAIALLERRGFKEEDFAELHPGGELGRKMRRVEHLMHPVEAIAVVQPEAPLRDVIEKISSAVGPDGRSFGVAFVVDEKLHLLGIITDGDLRRLIQTKPNLLDLTASQCMTSNPTTIRRQELATAALHLMESRKISSLPVASPDGILEGLLHLQDLWTTQMF